MWSSSKAFNGETFGLTTYKSCLEKCRLNPFASELTDAKPVKATIFRIQLTIMPINRSLKLLV